MEEGRLKPPRWLWRTRRTAAIYKQSDLCIVSNIVERTRREIFWLCITRPDSGVHWATPETWHLRVGSAKRGSWSFRALSSAYQEKSCIAEDAMGGRCVKWFDSKSQLLKSSSIVRRPLLTHFPNPMCRGSQII